MQKKGAIFFDVYDTLLFEERYTSFVEELVKLFSNDRNLVIQLYKETGRLSMSGKVNGMEGRLNALIHGGLQWSDAQTLQGAAEHLKDVYFHCLSIHSDTFDTLKALRDNYELTIVSNASDYTRDYLQQLQLVDYFEHIVLSCDVQAMKPWPAIYQAALTLSKFNARDVYFVGDGGDGELVGAKDAQFTTILLDRRLSHTSSATKFADYVVDHLSEIIPIVAECTS